MSFTIRIYTYTDVYLYKCSSWKPLSGVLINFVRKAFCEIIAQIVSEDVFHNVRNFKN